MQISSGYVILYAGKIFLCLQKNGRVSKIGHQEKLKYMAGNGYFLAFHQFDQF